MRLGLILIAWLLAGCAAAYFLAPPLFDAWFWMGWRAPVAEWLSRYVSDRIAGLWALVWVRMSDGLFLVAAGIAAGLLARRAALAGVAFALGFTALPWVLYPQFGLWPTGVLLRVAAMDVSVIALCAGTALLTARLRRRVAGRGFEVEPSGAESDEAEINEERRGP